MIEIIKYAFFDFSHLYNVIEPIAKAAPNAEVLAIKMPENVKNKATMIVLIKSNFLFTNKKTANIKPRAGLCRRRDGRAVHPHRCGAAAAVRV